MKLRRTVVRFLAVAALAAAAGAVPLQVDLAGAHTPVPEQPVSTHTLSIARRDGLILVSLTAQNALLSDVAADLARQSGVPITVSRAIASERLWTAFSDTPFETAVGRLTRRAFVDYMLRPGASAEPVVAQLVDGEETPTSAPGAAMGILISGDTETVEGPAQRDALRISLDFNQLTVVATRQPLALVLGAIAETLSVPYVPEYSAIDPVTISATDRPEAVLLKLSPNIRLRVRADLYRNERTVQRIILAAP